MARVNAAVAEFYISSLKDAKGLPPPQFDDTSRGVLLALIKERPTIWNSSAKLTKDDVLASFQQCSAVLSNMDPRFSIWVIIEKWCWVVESYIRSQAIGAEWRYNNTLDYLRPFNSPSYPYMGCLSKQRLAQLTQMYGDVEIIKVMESTENLEFVSGIFRDELAYFAGEEISKQKNEADLLARTVGQIVNAKKRGRPSKNDKRSPTDFINLTPQSAQFQKLLENNTTPAPEPNKIDEYGLTPAIYEALIEMIHEKPEVWQSNHPDKDQNSDGIFEEFARQLSVRFKDSIETDKMDGSEIRKAWNRLKETFGDEENSDNNSKWRHFQSLQFLSTRSMPAYLFENVLIKSEDSSSKVASPSDELSRMAASSPASQFVALPTNANGNKSIQTVLENLVARSLKEEQGGVGEYSELKHILDQKIIKTENENGPAAKRLRSEPSPPGSSRMIMFNDTRKTTQAPISTWVPPREDLAAKPKEESVPTSTPKKPQATAVVKNGIPLDKHLKKMLQQSNPSLVPVSASSIQSRNGLLALNPMILQSQSALQQALLTKKCDPPTPMTSLPTLPSVSTPSVVINGGMNGNSEPEDKWALLGRMITMMAREVESRDPVAACELFRDLQQVLYQQQMKSLLPKENNSQS